MRLLDLVVAAPNALLIKLPHVAEPIALPSPSVLGPDLKETSLRYICDARVSAVCTGIAADFGFLASCLDLLRFPATRIWFEWDEAARRGGGCNERAPARVGALIRTDASGRRGKAEVCWTSPHADGGVDLSPVVIHFDFDDPSLRDSARAGGDIALEVEAQAQLNAILKRLRFSIRPEWMDYYALQGAEASHEARVADAAVIALDFPYTLALSLLLAAQEPVHKRPIDRAKLNRRRVRRGNAALLDHTELTTVLGAVDDEPLEQRENDHGTARRHVVRGHLVRRNNGVFWRRTHFRGNLELGVVGPKTVKLRMAR